MLYVWTALLVMCTWQTSGCHTSLYLNAMSLQGTLQPGRRMERTAHTNVSYSPRLGPHTKVLYLSPSESISRGHHTPQWLRRPNVFLDAGAMATTAYMEAL